MIEMNKDDELISTHISSGWKMCVDYQVVGPNA